MSNGLPKGRNVLLHSDGDRPMIEGGWDGYGQKKQPVSLVEA